jgi:tRNA dimethylallyltransferase
MEDGNKTLIVITGPTAVGKTSIAIEIARYLQTHIISADSRQFFQDMKIGTAMPLPEELNIVPHHFVAFLPVTAHYDAASFEKDALNKLNHIFSENSTALMAGGSGLYIDAVCKGFDDLPKVDLSIRHELNQCFLEKGIAYLQNRLKEKDPEYYLQVDINNPQRLIRALEVCISTGKPYSSFRTNKSKKRPFKILKIALERNREELYARINDRVDQMMTDGLIDEVKNLLPYRNANALQTVGYKELISYFEEKMTLQEAISQIKQNTRRYAKRQLTWLRKDNDFHWFNANEPDKILNFIKKELNA